MYLCMISLNIPGKNVSKQILRSFYMFETYIFSLEIYVFSQKKTSSVWFFITVDLVFSISQLLHNEF